MAMKVTCLLKEPKKQFVISDLDPRSTVSALKASIVAEGKLGDDVELTLLFDDQSIACKDSDTLKKAQIKDGATITCVASAKAKKEAKKDIRVDVVPEIKAEPEIRAKPKEEGEFKYDLGFDWKKGEVDLEAEEKNWGSVEFEEDKEEESVADAAAEDPLASPPPMLRQRSYVVMGKDDISQLQKDLVDELVKAVDVSVSRGLMILRAYDWELDKAVAAYKEDAKKTLEKAGVKEPTAEEAKSKPPLERQDSSAEFQCGSCFCDYPRREGYALHCGHRYCNDCWHGWISASFDKGQECVFTECPYGELKTKCKEMVPPTFMLKNLDAKKRERFAEWQAAAFIKQTQTVKWCPRPGCDKAVECRKKGPKKVTCACGYSFCFGCGQEDHEPAPCDDVVTWMKKCTQESDIFKWLAEQKDNTEVKNCTKCKIVIEKNQGCKHMTCRNCRHEFCWLCFQDWHGHDNGYCSQYVQDHAGERESKERMGEESGDDFRRYQFYFGRWEHYRNSIKFAQRIKENAEKRMDALQNMKGSGSTSVQFLLDAVETVISCRKLLEWSYAWSYFLKESGPMRELFRNHLNNLEEFTEELGELTEQPLDKLMLDSQRTEVVNKTRVIQKYKKNIIDFAREHHGPKSPIDVLSPTSPGVVPKAPPL